MNQMRHGRRAFLGGALGVAIAGAGITKGPPEDMAAAGRLSGLNFSEEETRQAATQLRQLKTNYQAIRSTEIPFALSPCTSFDPVPPGHARADPTPRRTFEIPVARRPIDESDIAFASVLELASWMRQGIVTAVSLAELCLKRLKTFDPQLLCVVNLLEESALAEAKRLDDELGAGQDRGILHGIPFGAKDLFGWPGTNTTFGAAPWKDHVWDVEATCLKRLKEAGAVLVAKLSLGALAMGDLWHGGRTRNPWQPDQGSSGSSAGPASAVAAGLVPFAVGTETLGSIVSPCRQCGVAGLRPTFGTISRYGAMPLSWTMDKVGPIARNAVDAAIAFDAMRGADGLDPSASDCSFLWKPGMGLSGLRVGLLKQNDFPKRAEDVAFVEWLKSQGVKLESVELPKAPTSAMLTMLHAEAAAAFDESLRAGLLGALPGQSPNDWPSQFRAARTIPAVEYLQASRARSALQVNMAAALSHVDLFVAPTHAGPTLVTTNLTGHPTYVLPVGQDDKAANRPTVLALVGQLYAEGPLLRVAEAWQESTSFHRGRPALTR